MKKINGLIKQSGLKPYRYIKNGNVTLIDTEIGRFAIKKKNRNNEIFNYLRSRDFDYYPNVVYDENEYEITEFVEDVYEPTEQKVMDLARILSLLHNKTTHFREVDYEDYKKIYEDINNNIEYLHSYYNDIMTLIESHVYMSPSEYLLARNISRVYGALNYSKTELEKWYKLIKDKTKQRYVVLHNNADLSHFIKNELAYLLSWDKVKFGLPIFDLYVLYRRHGLDFDFGEILKHYEKEYPLLEEERNLFFILITLPDRILFEESEYELTKKVSREIDLLYKTERFISPYYVEEDPHDPKPQDNS